GDSSELSQAVSEGAREQNRRTEHEALRLEKMRAYAELGSCRREYLLQYFGDDGPAQCGNWDVCEFGRKRSLGR
ncbi:MAG TPA: RecQ family zinc-binding domain-containing protein, partial [Bryobacteraceae bacterium]|nr:RecQ family zinc-binding domain-containing protein [Bryobacteraceae bacterium]